MTWPYQETSRRFGNVCLNFLEWSHQLGNLVFISSCSEFGTLLPRYQPFSEMQDDWQNAFLVMRDPYWVRPRCSDPLSRSRGVVKAFPSSGNCQKSLGRLLWSSFPFPFSLLFSFSSCLTSSLEWWHPEKKKEKEIKSSSNSRYSNLQRLIESSNYSRQKSMTAKQIPATAATWATFFFCSWRDHSTDHSMHHSMDYWLKGSITTWFDAETNKLRVAAKLSQSNRQ